MTEITIYGVGIAERRTLTIRNNNKTAWFDLDRQAYIIHEPGKKPKIFEEESQFAEAITSLRRNIPAGLGEEAYNAMQQGTRIIVPFREGYITTGEELPDWLESKLN